MKPPIPPASEWAKGNVWPQAQIDAGADAILCLRPPALQGLPLVILHNAFRHFNQCINEDLPRNEEGSAALLAAKALCNCMGNSFKTRRDRLNAFQYALDPFIPKTEWLPEQWVTVIVRK